MTDFKDSVIGSIISGKKNENTDKQMAMIQVGLSLLGPQRAGSTTLQNVAQAGAQGLNYLSRIETSRTAAADKAQRTESARRLSEAQAANFDEATKLAERKTDQVDRTNQIRLYEAMTDREKSQLIYRAALGKTKEVKDETRQKVLIELIKQDAANEAAGGKSDPLGLISKLNIYLAPDFTFDKFKYDAGTGLYTASTNLTAATDEDGNPIPAFLDKLTAQEVASMGGNPKQIRAIEEQQIALQKEKLRTQSVADASVESGIVPTDVRLPRVEVEREGGVFDEVLGWRAAEAKIAEEIATDIGIPETAKINIIADEIMLRDRGTARYSSRKAAVARARVLLKSTVARSGANTFGTEGP